MVGVAADAVGAVAPDPDAAVAASSPVLPGAPASLRSPTPVGSLTRGGSAAGWGWPLEPRPGVLARFDPPDVAWGAGHRGVDLAAEVGQSVLAPTAGVVSFSGVVVDRGVLVLTTSNGLRLGFEPVDEGPPPGTVVARGDTLGQVAPTPGHCLPVTCLHWGVRRDDTYLDPLAFVGIRRVVLLPLQPP